MDKALASGASNLGSNPSGDIYPIREAAMSIDPSIQEELKQLRQEIHRHNYLYNTLDQPEISDFEYDQLFNRLKEIEARYPELDHDSPTQRVGSKILEGFNKVRHPAQILSLANGFTQPTLDWYERISKLDSRVRETDFLLEPKQMASASS